MLRRERCRKKSATNQSRRPALTFRLSSLSLYLAEIMVGRILTGGQGASTPTPSSPSHSPSPSASPAAAAAASSAFMAAAPPPPPPLPAVARRPAAPAHARQHRSSHTPLSQTPAHDRGYFEGCVWHVPCLPYASALSTWIQIRGCGGTAGCPENAPAVRIERVDDPIRERPRRHPRIHRMRSRLVVQPEPFIRLPGGGCTSRLSTRSAHGAARRGERRPQRRRRPRAPHPNEATAKTPCHRPPPSPPRHGPARAATRPALPHRA
ncbi:Protein of unknown function [Gryllus bimaculatus]|nr:Protein of unknown function [Gryllus bimaculatus]